MPPYILLYRIPKFLLVDWIVLLANAIDNKLKAIGAALQRAVQKLKMRIKMVFVNFWNQLKTTFAKTMSREERDDDEPLSFLAFIAEGIVGLYRITLHPLITGAKKGWQLSKRCYKALREFPMQLHHKIQETLKLLSTLRDRLIKWAKNYAFELKEVVANRTVRPVSRWIDAKVEALTVLARRMSDKLKKLSKELLFACRHPIQTAKALRDRSRNSYKRFSNLVNSWFEARKRALKSFWERQLTWFDKKIAAPVHANWKQLRAFGQRWLAKISAPFIKAYRLNHPRVVAVKEKVVAFLKEHTATPRGWLQQKAVPFQAAYSSLKNGLESLYAKIETKAAKRLEKVKQTAKALAEPFLWAGREFLALLKPIWQPIVNRYQGFLKRLDALVYRLRRLVAWSRVLTRYGMELVRGSTASLFG